MSQAFSWNGSIVAPADGGVGVITSDDREIWFDTGSASPAQISADGHGLIVFTPPPLASAPFRIRADLSRQPLSLDDGWVSSLLQVVPLLDGSVLQICADGAEKVLLRVTNLESLPVDGALIESWVDQLSDASRTTRETAFAELSRYGPGIWPLLTRLEPDQPPAGKAALRRILGERLQPTLAGMTPVDGKLRLTQRLADFGSVFTATSGVRARDSLDRERLIRPACIAVRPGRAIALLPAALAREVASEKVSVYAWNDEWIISDPTYGPRRFMSNHFETLLHEQDRTFQHFVGVDRRGRWAFAPARDVRSPTLLIDPTLRDPTPKLPVWEIINREGSVGWDQADWPTTKRGGSWALHEAEWEAVDEKINPILTALPQLSTPPATPQGRLPLLTAGDGTTYFGGRSDLLARRADGSEVRWDLPAHAVGSIDPTLIEAGESRLFLFNEPGRVVRIKPDPAARTPFVVEAIFTDKIPNGAVRRIWLDPAGRIVIACDGNRLAILFPDGSIPQKIAMKMPGK